MQPQNTKQQKYDAQKAALGLINKKRLFSSVPLKLAGLIALAPAYIAYRIFHTHVSHTIIVVIFIVIYTVSQLLVGLYLRYFLRKHPDMKWGIIIR